MIMIQTYRYRESQLASTLATTERHTRTKLCRCIGTGPGARSTHVICSRDSRQCRWSPSDSLGLPEPDNRRYPQWSPTNQEDRVDQSFFHVVIPYRYCEMG